MTMAIDLVYDSYMTGRYAATMQEGVRLGVLIVGMHPRRLARRMEKFLSDPLYAR